MFVFSSFYRAATMVNILLEKFGLSQRQDWRFGYPRLEESSNNKDCYSFSFFMLDSKLRLSATFRVNAGQRCLVFAFLILVTRLKSKCQKSSLNLNFTFMTKESNNWFGIFFLVCSWIQSVFETDCIHEQLVWNILPSMFVDTVCFEN